MNPNHKHYEVAKAWLEGAEIESRCPRGGDWYVNKSPSWDENWEYRVKPEPQWYDNIPEQGVLCWVSDCEKHPDKSYGLKIITKKSEQYFYEENGCTWEFATPLTEAEIRQFLPANDLQRKLAVLEAFKQEHCPDWRADWNDLTQEKWFVLYSHYFKHWTLDCTSRCELPTTIYFNKQTAELLAAKLNSGEIKL